MAIIVHFAFWQIHTCSCAPKGEWGNPHSSKIWPLRFAPKRYKSIQKGHFPYLQEFEGGFPNNSGHISPRRTSTGVLDMRMVI